jgi:hypothetical protein
MATEKGAVFWHNGIKSVRAKECPGDDWVRGRIKYKRESPSDDTRKRISESNIGKTAWNKGSTASEDARQKMSKSAKNRAARGIMPDNRGKIPWNKGLTKDTHSSIMKSSSKQKGQYREGKYPLREDHPNWSGHRSEFREYRYKVQRLTELNYTNNIDKINPNGHKRTRAGVESGWQLDHIYSVYEGFLNNIDPSEIAKVGNLQMLPWKDNRIKGTT